jgi:hypothetical protein
MLQLVLGALYPSTNARPDHRPLELGERARETSTCPPVHTKNQEQ